MDTLPRLSDLPDLPKPWHYEFWKDIPDPSEVPFRLRHVHVKIDDDLDQAIAQLNPDGLSFCKNPNLSTVEAKDTHTETVNKSFSSYNLSQIELASSNPFKMSATISKDYLKEKIRSPSVSEESSWEYYSHPRTEFKVFCKT